MSNIQKRFYEFGRFRLDPAERLLWSDGQPVALPPKVFATLLVLVENAPGVVEKDELLKTIWPDTFVEESNLSQNVFSLRKVLGEPECIENIPRRGYRFIAPVHRPEAVSETPAIRKKSRGAGLAAGAAALLILTGAILYQRYGHPRSQGPTSIVVLPFLNLSADPANDYFSDGLTEELIDALARLENVQVVARTTAFQYKGKSQDIRTIGKQVGATAVVEGSVRREGNRVRITAQLNAAGNGYHLWSQTYERDLKDVFAIQPEIATAIGTALRGRLKGVRSTTPGAVNPEAYDYYLRARYHLNRFKNRRDNDEAIALLEKSTAIDPLFAAAQAQLAFAYGAKSFFLDAGDPQWEDKAFAAIQRAEALDVELPEVHYGRSQLLWSHSHGFPHREALAEARKAYSIQPSFDEAWHIHAVILFHIGHIREAWPEIEKTLSINPANDQARYRIGPMLNYQMKWQEAIDALNHVPREAIPGLWTYQMAWALQSLNRLPEASRLLEAALAEDAGDPGGNLYGARAMVRAKSGDRQGAQADVATAIRVGKGFGHFHHTAYSIAAVYSVLGDLDKAQEWIENAANDGFPCYTLFEADPNLERLRATVRFQAFVAKLRREYEHIPGETE